LIILTCKHQSNTGWNTKLSQYVPVQVHKEGLQELTDVDFLRQMGIGCDDSGLQLIQISEITSNIDCQQV